MDIFQKRKIRNSIFFIIGTTLTASAIYFIESSNSKTGIILAILGLYSLSSGIYMHQWNEVSSMEDLRDIVDNAPE